jgi:ribosome maturation factor RimP
MHRTGHAELLGELHRRAERVVTAAGLELVELCLRGSGRRRVLRVDIDRAGPAGVGLEDCQRISNELGEDLEQSELLRSGYMLEVSSPGVDRPIRSADDFRRNTGRRVVVTTVEPLGGRSCFRGELLGSDGECLELVEDGHGVVRIPLDRVEKARQDVML